MVVSGWLVIRALTDGRADEQRAIAARQHPSQQTLDADAALTEPDADASAAPAPASGEPAGLAQQGTPFVERFDGPRLSDRWFVSDGWSNGSWMANDWRASEIEMTPQGLALHLRKAPEGSKYELAGSEIRTLEFYRYGYFEIRMKIPRDPGILMGAFTYAPQENRARPNEIDIEILGRAPRVAELTIHEGGRPTHQKITLPFDSSEDFHTYGFDWQPDYVRWYADGRVIHEETGPAVRRLVRPQQFIVSLWASRELSSWVGNLDTSRAPWRMDVRCIAYAPAYSGPLCD